MFKQLFTYLLCIACTTNIYATQAPVKDKKSEKKQSIPSNTKKIQKILNHFIKKSNGDQGWVLRNLVARGLFEETAYFFQQNKTLMQHVNSQGKRTGDTALHHAVKQKNPRLVLLLIQKSADVDIKNNDGETPRDIASKKDYNSMSITTLCNNRCIVASNKTSNNRGFFITMPFRYPNFLGPLSELPKQDPTILLIGPGTFCTEVDYKTSYQPLYKLNFTSPKLAEILSLFPKAKKIDVVDINKDMYKVMKNTIQQLPNHEKAWDAWLQPGVMPYLNPYQKSLKNVFLKMKKNTTILGQGGFTPSLKFINKNALDCEYPYQHYDIIVALNVFIPEYLGKKYDECKEIVPRLLRSLKPGGWLYMDDKSLGPLIQHDITEFEVEEVQSIVDKFLEKNNCGIACYDLLIPEKKAQVVYSKDKGVESKSLHLPFYAIFTAGSVMCLQKLGKG